MKRLVVMGLLVLVGCAPATPPPAKSVAEIGAVGLATSSGTGAVRPAYRLNFFDSEAFDANLSEALATNPKQVHIALAANTTINAFPGRLNAWLVEVKKSQGRVDAKDPSDSPDQPQSAKTRGVLTEIFDVFSMWRDSQVRAEEYEPVHKYNAVILFNQTTGLATEVVLDQR